VTPPTLSLACGKLIGGIPDIRRRQAGVTARVGGHRDAPRKKLGGPALSQSVGYGQEAHYAK
jgi:hypothetical protein